MREGQEHCRVRSRIRPVPEPAARETVRDGLGLRRGGTQVQRCAARVQKVHAQTPNARAEVSELLAEGPLLRRSGFGL